MPSGLPLKLHVAFARRARSALGVIAAVAVILLAALSGDARASFGIAQNPALTTTATEGDGTIDTRAGSHPYQYTVAFKLDENSRGEVEGNLRDALVDLPAGLIGSPRAVPRCPRQRFDGSQAFCPGDTQVGVLEASVENLGEPVAPLFNLVPPPGVPAQLGISANGLSGILDASVRTGAGYGLRLSAYDIPVSGVKSVRIRLWGVPPETSHDHERQCVEEENGERKVMTGCSSDLAPEPFLTLPTSCGGPLSTTLAVDSVEAPGVFSEEEAQSLDAGENPIGLFGCESLPFDPAFALAPESAGTEEPSGTNIELKLPQSESPGGLAEADLEQAEVVLPEGVTVSPSAASGLTACPLTGPEAINLASSAPAGCPNSSKIATVTIRTPLLEEELHGSVFVAQQGNRGQGYGSNPFGSLLAIYVVAEGDGIAVKIPGEIELQEGTGRLTVRLGPDPTTSEPGLPQLPYSDLHISLFGGSRALLSTPPQCGTFTTTAKLTPWSATPPVESASTFTIDQGCGAPGFAPSFTAGSVNPHAGVYTTFTQTFARDDHEQLLGRLKETLPPGLLANLASVPLCPDAGATSGSCPEASRIGSVTVQAGAGTTPLSLPGRIYLTGPYEGGPFGVAVEVPAIAGPLDLDRGEEPLTLRGSIHIDPTTAQATIATDPFPTILQGIPLDVRTVQVTFDRPGFIFNPTDCEPLSITGVIGSAAAGASPADVSSPFQAADCATLPFNPRFTASSSAHTSYADGASLTVRVSYPPGSLGKQANIKSVEVQLPKSLPSRLATLQRACTARTFEADPAACPAQAVIGHAVVRTRVLPVPLDGPVYLVSHGAEAFPGLAAVLQGDGVTIELVGETLIQNGVTSATFTSIPDVPFESFELTFPEGKYALLGASRNLCRNDLRMPTALTAQNGATLSQDTRIEVDGCSTVLSVISSRVERRTLRLTVYTPSAGKLTVTGKGLGAASERSSGTEAVNLTLHANRAGRFATHVKLSFAPSRGKRQSKTLKITFDK